MRQLGLPVRLHLDAHTDAVSAGVQLAGYRVVQEGLTNVLKHAGPVDTEVTVSRTSPQSLTVEVSSAPGGDTAPLPGGSRGLTGLRARVGALGGTLTTLTRPDGGFAITATLPLVGMRAAP